MNENDETSSDNSELCIPEGNELADTIAPSGGDACAETVDPTSTIDQSLPKTLAGSEPTASDATQDFAFDSDATQDLRKSPSATKQPGSHVPKMIGGYEIIRVLGHGAMGIVYKAKQKKLDRIVALKMVLAGSHASADQLARFISEAKAVGQLQHPNIVQVFDIGEHENLPFFSLEYVDGDSLDKQLARKPIAPLAAAKLLEKLCRAMQYAHEHGILHRDLKPANVLISRDGIPKIADFGLAKRLEDSDDSASTRTGTIMGTPSYMSQIGRAHV